MKTIEILYLAINLNSLAKLTKNIKQFYLFVPTIGNVVISRSKYIYLFILQNAHFYFKFCIRLQGKTC